MIPDLFTDISLYQQIAFVVSLTLALVLLLIKIPHTEYASKLTRSKGTVACNYLIMAFIFAYTLSNSGTENYEAFSSMTMLI
ncbi:membrane protein, partial [gut metagenome]